MTRLLLHSLNWLIRIIKYALLLAAILLIAGLAIIASAYTDLKQAGQQGLEGKASLELAVQAAQNGRWLEAKESAISSQTSFNQALDALAQAKQKKALNQIPPLRQQINDLEYLIKTAEILSRSLTNVLPLTEEISKASSSSFSDLSAEHKEGLLRLIYQAEPELSGLKANLDLARLNLNQIHRIGVLWPIYGQISDLRQELDQASSLLEEVIPLSRLLPHLAGYPDASRFLLIMQNNDEIRPSGGFIGVYGLMENRAGEIVSLLADDSYHVDMPAVGKWRLEPPMPIQKYMNVENWYLRDANWSPDWPTSARQILSIYAGEKAAVGEATPGFDGVIAINPDFVADLIDLVGPITIGGEEYRGENFQPLLQYNVEMAYKEKGVSSWDRKDVVNDLLKEMEKRLSNLEASRWPKLLEIIKDNIAAKNIQAYFIDQSAQSLIVDLGADGRVKGGAADYLMVVDANLAAYKTDAVMDKTINYQISPMENGLEAELVLGYGHQGGFDWRTTRYRSYTRVYVPLGSELISIDGLDKSKSDLSVANDVELEKTIFGFFFSVEPGNSETITIRYRLPAGLKALADSGRYELLVQKQSGRRTKSLKVDLKLADPFFFIGDLETDKVFRAE